MSLESIYRLSLIFSLIDNLTGPMNRIDSKVGSSLTNLQRFDQSMGDMTRAGTAMAGIGAQITKTALEPVAATFETKRAIGELASLGVKDLGAVEAAARSFSGTWSGTTKPEFISAAYDIKSGIASLSDQGVADMTTLAALTAKATKSTADEMTSLFASGYGIYKQYYNDLSDLEFGEMFSAGIAKSVQQFKTTGSGMAQSIQTLGGSATTANVPLEEQLSILGMLQATMGGAEAGTKYKAFLRSAVKGGEALGISVMDSNNQLLSMPEILDKLRGKFGETMDAAEKMQLQQAFGDTEAVSLIDLMYSKTGELQTNILGMYDALGSGVGVTTEMANAMNQTDPGRFDVLKQKLGNVTELIGNTLSPTMDTLMTKADGLLTKAGTFIEKNQGLVRGIMLVVLVLGGFLTVTGTTIAILGAFGLAVSKTIGVVGLIKGALKTIPDKFETMRLYGMLAADGLKKAFGIIKIAGAGAVGGIKKVATHIGSMAKVAAVSGVTALKKLALGIIGMAKQAVISAVTALPGLIASVWAFTAALLANPITWVVIGIIALIAAVILLWRNWETVTAFLGGAWNSFCSGIGRGMERIKQFFAPLVSFMQPVFDFFGQSGRKIIDTLVGGIKAVASKPVDAIKSIFKKVRNLLPFSDAKEGPLSTLTLSGQRTMTTFADGVGLAQAAPAQAVEKGLSRAGDLMDRTSVKKVRLRKSGKTDASTEQDSSEGGTGVTIKKLILHVDFSKIEKLPLLMALLADMENISNSSATESGDTLPEPT